MEHEPVGGEVTTAVEAPGAEAEMRARAAAHARDIAAKEEAERAAESADRATAVAAPDAGRSSETAMDVESDVLDVDAPSMEFEEEGEGPAPPRAPRTLPRMKPVRRWP